MSVGTFNPFDPAVREDPYPAYRELVEHQPVHRSPWGTVMVAPYEVCRDALHSPYLGAMSSDSKETILRAMGMWDAWVASRIPATLNSVLLFMDPPAHDRVRDLISARFTPHGVVALEPLVGRIANGLIDELTGTVDLVESLASPLPTLVINDLLGVPREDWKLLRTWSANIAPLLDYVIDPDQLSVTEASLDGFIDYLEALLEDRRRQPQKDLLSTMALAEVDGQRLDDLEIIANSIFLFAAGNETSQNLIAGAIHLLLQHPDQLALVRDDPSLASAVVEEALRFDAPVQAVGRTVLEPTSIQGVDVAAGDGVVLLLGAANRDGSVYEEPDAFDIRRSGPRPLSFGGGIHYCLGATLARLEARLAITGLLKQYPDMQLSGEPVERRSTFILRGLTRLVVDVGQPA